MSFPEADVLRREAAALSELAALQRDPVYRGVGVPHGDSRVVLVLPGLFGNDFYLQPLHHWLRRLGYRSAHSTLTIDAGCPERLRTHVEASLRRRRERRSGPVALIGHSRGGMLAWAVAGRLEDDASHLVLLGCPASAMVAMMRAGIGRNYGSVARGSVANVGRRSLQLLDPDCNVPEYGYPYTDDIRRGLRPRTRVLAVYRRDDQIVPPAACQVASGIGTNVEAVGTHSGLVLNRAIYPTLPRFFAADR